MKTIIPLAALALAACASSSTTGGASTASTATPTATASVATAAPTSACDSMRAAATATSNIAPAQPLPGNPRPPYPNDAGISFDGRVTAQFVVKPDGKVDMSTFKVVQSDHDAFTTSLRNTLPDWRFRPAEIAPGCRIAHLETMPFDFTTR